MTFHAYNGVTVAEGTSSEVHSSDTGVSTPRKRDLLDKAQQTVRRVEEAGVTIGTATRISTDMFVTASHAISNNGRLLACTIDDVPVKLVFSIPAHDFAIVKGELMPQHIPRPSFKLAFHQHLMSGCPPRFLWLIELIYLWLEKPKP